MSKKWSTDKKWASLMTQVHWKGLDNWEMVDAKLLEDEIPAIEDWARKQINYIPDEAVRVAFRKFFTEAGGMSQYDYLLKNQAFVALAALYRFQETFNGRS